MMRRPTDRIALRCLLLAIGVVVGLWALSDTQEHWPHDQILDAIRFVESSDRPNPPDGDGGRAIGPYQIHEVYWRDALAAEPTIGGSYQDCRQRAYAELVMGAYMRRYVPDAWTSGDAETIARTHNGGPAGAQKDSTSAYWDKVRARLP